MKHFLLLIFLSALIFPGCLVFHKINYVIKLEGVKNGVAEITVYDIRSDAESIKDFEEDKNNLFNYMLKSDDFVAGLLDEGKNLSSRELYVEDDKLNGKAVFSFNDVSNVEKITYDEGFYYLTMAVGDSIISTNGQVVVSSGHKRIIWDKSFKSLQFEMLSADFTEDGYRELAPFYTP